MSTAASRLWWCPIMHFSPGCVCRKALTSVRHPHILNGGLIQPLVSWMTTCVPIVYLHIMKAAAGVIKLHQSMC